MITAQVVAAKIAELLHLPDGKIDDGAVLTELITDSFLLVEVVVELQETYGVRLVQEDLKRVATVADLAALIVARAGA
jgi:acyl carrier protein